MGRNTGQWGSETPGYGGLFLLPLIVRVIEYTVRKRARRIAIVHHNDDADRSAHPRVRADDNLHPRSEHGRRPLRNAATDGLIRSARPAPHFVDGHAVPREEYLHAVA